MEQDHECTRAPSEQRRRCAGAITTSEVPAVAGEPRIAVQASTRRAKARDGCRQQSGGHSGERDCGEGDAAGCGGVDLPVQQQSTAVPGRLLCHGRSADRLRHYRWRLRELPDLRHPARHRHQRLTKSPASARWYAVPFVASTPMHLSVPSGRRNASSAASASTRALASAAMPPANTRRLRKMQIRLP